MNNAHPGLFSSWDIETGSAQGLSKFKPVPSLFASITRFGCQKTFRLPSRGESPRDGFSQGLFFFGKQLNLIPGPFNLFSEDEARSC